MRDKHHTCSVDRSIDNLEVFLTFDNFRVDRDRVNFFQINIVHILTDNLDKVFVAFELDISSRRNLVYFVDDTLVVWSKYLCTIIPVCLVAVVFLRIV